MNLRTYLDGLPRGQTAELARTLGISSVYLLQVAARQDGRQAAPELCVRIEVTTERAVRRWDLRPDDWHRIWPELIEPAREAGVEVPDEQGGDPIAKAA